MIRASFKYDDTFNVQDLVSHYQVNSLERIFPEVRSTLLVPYKDTLVVKKRQPAAGVAGKPYFIVSLLKRFCDNCQ